MTELEESTLSKDKHLFAQMSPRKLFLHCVIPGLISYIFMTAYHMVDGMFVGKYLGENALAAINLVSPIISITMSLLATLSIGSTVQIGIALGSGERLRANRIYTFCILFTEIVAILFMIFSFIFMKRIIASLGADPYTTELAWKYVKVHVYLSCFVMLDFTITNFLRVSGMIKRTMYINIFCACLNTFLDWLFIAHLGLGIEYAALATASSLSLITILGLIPFLSKKAPLKFTKPYMTFKLFFELIYNGSSEFFTSVSSSIFMLIANAVLLKLAGVTGVAAFSAVLYIYHITRGISYSTSDSILPAISYNFGVKDYVRVKKLNNCANLFAGISCAIIFIFTYIYRVELVSIFIEKDNIELINTASHGLTIFSFSFFTIWYNIIATSFLTALNKAKYSLILSVILSLIAPASLLLTLSHFIGITGVWLSVPISGVIGVLIAKYMYKKIYKELEI